MRIEPLDLLKYVMDSLKLQLEKSELLYLKLFAHNYRYKQIAEFLNIEIRKVLNIENGLRRKLGTQYCYDTIQKSFDLNVLDKNDYVREIIKVESLEITKFLLEQGAIDHKRIMAIIKSFLKRCYKKLLEENVLLGIQLQDFNTTEAEYLKLKYHRCDMQQLRKKLSITSEDFSGIESLILNKLQANSWYNAFRKAFEIKLLKREYTKKSKFFKNHLYEYGITIFKLIREDELEKVTKVDEIYKGLITLYNDLEYANLLQNKS